MGKGEGRRTPVKHFGDFGDFQFYDDQDNNYSEESSFFSSLTSQVFILHLSKLPFFKPNWIPVELLNRVNCKKKQRILRLTLLCDIPISNGIVFGLKSICEINNAMHFTFYNLSCVILFEIDSIFKHVIAN